MNSEENIMKTTRMLLLKECRIICLPFSRENYSGTVENAGLFRKKLDKMIKEFPERL